MRSDDLVEYGIQNEQSDYRIHVAFCCGLAFAFPTAAAVRALAGRDYPQFQAGQSGTNRITGAGFKVPPEDIPGCQEIEIPDDLLVSYPCAHDDSPPVKGRQAVNIAIGLLRRGLVLLPLLSREVEDADIQIQGVNLIITSRLRLQVKCDWWAARTGLRLQTAERNPFGYH